MPVEIADFLCFPEFVPLTHTLREIKIFLRNAFAREELGEAVDAPGPRDPGRRFAAVVFGREELPEDPPGPPRRRGAGLLRSLFAAEALPFEPPAPAKARPGLLRAIFAPEPLDELPPAPPRPGRVAWRRWLFRFERLDPP